MGMVQRSLDIIDCCIRHTTTLKDLQPLLCGFCLGYVFNHSVNIMSVLYPVSVCDEAGVCLPLREA